MLKLGICRLEDFNPQPSGIAAHVHSWLTKNRISLQLLSAAAAATPQGIALFESVMRQLQLTSGVYRTTFRGRFLHLDVFVNRLLLEGFPRETPLAAHDWAASDCLTSAEWASSLLPLFPRARLWASDLELFLIEVCLPGGAAFVLEADGQPLQYVRRPFVIWMNRPEPKTLIVNRFLSHHARKKLAKLRPMLLFSRDWIESDAGDLCLSAFRLRKISVVHPEAKALHVREPRFRIIRHSVFEALPEPVDVVRSMNIFNLVYFPTAKLQDGARAVWSSLKPGGWWIVGRTYRDSPPGHNVSILKKEEEGFRLFQRYGEGSEIEALVLASAGHVR